MNELELKNLPYTIIGHTAVPQPEISITLTAKGLKAIVDRIDIDDSVRIIVWSDVTEKCEKKSHYSVITVIKHE